MAHPVDVLDGFRRICPDQYGMKSYWASRGQNAVSVQPMRLTAPLRTAERPPLLEAGRRHEVAQDGLDRVMADLSQEVRLPVVVEAFREGFLFRSLKLHVGNGSDQVGTGGPNSRSGRQDALAIFD